MAKTHRAPNSTIHCTGSTKNDRKTWQNRTRNPEDGFESCSVHHKKFWNQTILELFLLLFALKSSWFTGGKKCNCNVISLGEFQRWPHESWICKYAAGLKPAAYSLSIAEQEIFIKEIRFRIILRWETRTNHLRRAALRFSIFIPLLFVRSIW